MFYFCLDNWQNLSNSDLNNHANSLFKKKTFTTGVGLLTYGTTDTKVCLKVCQTSVKQM